MKTFDTPEHISVDLELEVGTVQFDASDRHDTTVEVLPSDPRKKADVAAAEQTRVEFVNGHLRVEAPKSGWRQWSSSKRGSVEVRIGLPTGSRVRTEAGVATIRSAGRLGDVRSRSGVGDVHLEEVGSLELKTGAGDVTVDRATDKVELSCGSGRIRIGAADGPVVVKNSNGDTWIGASAGEARISAANGSITIDRSSGSVVAKTARGSVSLGDVAHGAVVAQSAFGAVEVGIRGGVAAWLDLDTKNGKVKNELDASSRPDPSDEVVEVQAHTSYGDVTVRRALAEV